MTSSKTHNRRQVSKVQAIFNSRPYNQHVLLVLKMTRLYVVLYDKDRLAHTLLPYNIKSVHALIHVFDFLHFTGFAQN